MVFRYNNKKAFAWNVRRYLLLLTTKKTDWVNGLGEELIPFTTVDMAKHFEEGGFINTSKVDIMNRLVKAFLPYHYDNSKNEKYSRVISGHRTRYRLFKQRAINAFKDEFPEDYHRIK